MDKIEWPVDKCEGCGYDLRETTVTAGEKSNDSSGRLKWTGFCPQCGHGMFVGDREAPKLNEMELLEQYNAPVLKQVEAKADTNDPEGQVTGIPVVTTAEIEVTPEDKPEPGAIKAPKPGEFFCTKCASAHKETSKQGKRHLKYREA